MNKNDWKKAYQALKHDRYQNLEMGTIRALLGALGALFLLNIYYRKPSWTCRYRDLEDIDYRLGSSIFSVQPPQFQNLWEEKVDLNEGSPFIARYHEDSLLEIRKIEMEVEEGIKDFLYTQPEIGDQDFFDYLNRAFIGESNSKNSLMAIVMEWGKYRINKKIPQDLSFEERKRLFVNSEEWLGEIYQRNHQMEEEKLVEENIQSEIDRAGALWGVERTRYMYKTPQWLNAVNNGMCTVSILKIEDIRE
ncbi:MAG: hypothetical protein KHZ82_08715 [Peptoniphilus harei]|nr:hypothetical protein [Peptoniphilus harei]